MSLTEDGSLYSDLNWNQECHEHRQKLYLNFVSFLIHEIEKSIAPGTVNSCCS